MSSLKNKIRTFANTPNFSAAGVILLIILAVLLLLFSGRTGEQPSSPLMAQVKFEGEYRIGEGEWQSYAEGRHIPATEGDVTLRGHFHLFAPNGDHVGLYDLDLPIAFYTDHINLTICEDGNDPYTIDIENPLLGPSLCGEGWTAYHLTGGSSDALEIRVHNPHRFGNETAVDDLLANLAIWNGIDFESGIMADGKLQRNIGLAVIIVSVFFLGAALFSLLIHVNKGKIIWLMGAVFFFAGLYLEYSAPGVSFWQKSLAVNTAILGISMMLYMVLVCCGIIYFLKKTKRVGAVAVLALGLADALFLLIPLLSGVPFYDVLALWLIAQTAVSIVLLLCLIRDFIAASEKRLRTICFLMILPLIAFEVDAAANALALWRRGLASECVFAVLFVASLFMTLKIVPESINASERAKEMEQHKLRLEAELKESRVSIMLSQIRPHFIYNTLGTIERMCLKDPEKAFDLVRNFSLYLRGNFSELDSVAPIRFSEELKHIEYYVNIEKVRFPDMSIEYDVETTDFLLPALSVQPLVENAIKHGLMRLETGGTVLIRSYETPAHFCVEVRDDGAGFDTSLPIDVKKHVGLRNIRERLKTIVNGDLLIESRPNAGTVALITIPKEV